MSNKTILYISHKKSKCGVYEFGKNIGEILTKSTRYNFVYKECDSLEELHEAIATFEPAVIIYNYHPATLSWVRKKIIHTSYKSLIKDIQAVQIGVIHEVTQEKADKADDQLFDYHIAADPTLLLKNPLVFKTGRLVPNYTNQVPSPVQLTIGSFGFATPNKGFEKIVAAVNNEFDTAIIRFNIPFADFGDKDGSNAMKIVDTCKTLITKPGIQLEITHKFLTNAEVLHFLAENSINVFLYEDETGRGLSSTIDYALAVERPIAVSGSLMFRHLHNIQPSIIYGESSLQEILNQGTDALLHLKTEWSGSNLLWEYERIIDAVLKRETVKTDQIAPGLGAQVKQTVRSLLGFKKQTFSWLRNTSAATEDTLSIDSSIRYTPVIIPEGISLNRILDNSARALYRQAIEKLTELVPLTVAKKITEANVQQAFVFDTVFRLAREYKNPRILCVGSYEDTASMSLIRMGYQVEEIDPMINYFLQEFYTKPTTQKNSYDIVFSTSVIEHDPHDESFIACVEGLMAPGAHAVITCDYKDNWKPGDLKPEVDARLYTQDDLKQRLMGILPNCSLVDQPQWDCPDPDFHYLGKYVYTFASLVFKKNQ